MIKKEILEDLIEKGHSLTEIAKMYDVDVSWISRLCKRYGIKPPSPGRRVGSRHNDETKRKIGNTIRDKR